MMSTNTKSHEVVPHRLWNFSVLVLFGLGGALSLGLWLKPQDLPLIPLCAFRFFLHHDCPGCGMTRAFLHLARGQFAAAWVLNPASVPFYFLLLSIWCTELWRVMTGTTDKLPLYYRKITPVLTVAIGVFALLVWIL